MTQDLAIRQSDVGIFLPPDIVLENARTAARALAAVLSNKKKPVIMNGEQYLEFEDWQTCGQFYGYTVKTGEAMPVEIDGVKGAKATADLIDIKTGMYLGGAEAYCMRDEEHWNTRPRYEWQGEGDDRKRVKVGDEVVPWFQLASMAQTRAGAKALRNRLAWVVVLAGFKATPAEEMTEHTVSEAVKERRTIDKSEHYCELHGVNFFKRGKMKSYAHPVKDADGNQVMDDNDKPLWCHERTETPSTDPKPEQPPDPASEVIESIISPVEDEGGSEPLIDMNWLKENIASLQTVVPKAWSTDTIFPYMVKNYGVDTSGCKTIMDAASKITDKGKAAHFVTKIEEALKMI